MGSGLWCRARMFLTRDETCRCIGTTTEQDLPLLVYIVFRLEVATIGSNIRRTDLIKGDLLVFSTPWSVDIPLSSNRLPYLSSRTSQVVRNS